MAMGPRGMHTCRPHTLQAICPRYTRCPVSAARVRLNLTLQHHSPSAFGDSDGEAANHDEDASWMRLLRSGPFHHALGQQPAHEALQERHSVDLEAGYRRAEARAAASPHLGKGSSPQRPQPWGRARGAQGGLLRTAYAVGGMGACC